MGGPQRFRAQKQELILFCDTNLYCIRTNVFLKYNYFSVIFLELYALYETINLLEGTFLPKYIQ